MKKRLKKKRIPYGGQCYGCNPRGEIVRCPYLRQIKTVYYTAFPEKTLPYLNIHDPNKDHYIILCHQCYDYGHIPHCGEGGKPCIEEAMICVKIVTDVPVLWNKTKVCNIHISRSRAIDKKNKEINARERRRIYDSRKKRRVYSHKRFRYMRPLRKGYILK